MIIDGATQLKTFRSHHGLLEDLHITETLTGTIKFTKINTLPAAQEQFPVMNNDGLGCPYHTRFQVGRRIPLSMPILSPIPWGNLTKPL